VSNYEDNSFFPVDESSTRDVKIELTDAVELKSERPVARVLEDPPRFWRIIRS